MKMRKEEADRIWLEIQRAQKAAEKELEGVLLKQQLEAKEEKLLDKLNLRKQDGRILAGRRRAAKNRERKRIVEWTKKKRHDLKVMLVEQGEWWPFLWERWVANSIKVDMSEAEWNELVKPHIQPMDYLYISRYDTSQPISWDNIYVEVERDAAAGSRRLRVIYDGKEEKLRALGYCL